MLSGWTLIDLNNVGSGKREVEIVVIDKRKKKSEFPSIFQYFVPDHLRVSFLWNGVRL